MKNLTTWAKNPNQLTTLEETKMGMDLINRHGDDFSINWHGWRSMLELAFEFGWEPAGTISRDSEVSTGYFHNDGQKVTAEDSLKLADALKKAYKLLSSLKYSSLNYCW